MQSRHWTGEMIKLQHKFLFVTIFSILCLISPKVSAKPYKTLVAPITKDTRTSLYSLTLNFNKKYVIDLGGPFLWHHCPKHHRKISCLDPKCLVAQSYQSSLCPSINNTDGKHQCTCIVNHVNPITKTCTSAELTYIDLIMSWTDGHIPTLNINIHHLYASCAPHSVLRSLPIGSSGMAGLSRASLALPMQFTQRYHQVRREFAICLPGGDYNGVAFFGEGPFYLMAAPEFDVLRRAISYTPLLKHPTNLDYYIDLKAISINGKICKFLARVLEFDSLGHGGVKLSTLVPYTTMRRHIYWRFIKDFAYSTRGYPRAKKVKPFDYCLNTTDLGSTRVGLPVPQIDLELGNGKNWTIFGSNSMKQVSEEVACLAFVDGGERAKEAVVIGAFQMEDNFLLFDLVRSTLGFSSTLSFGSTSCGNFNFTAGV